MISEQSSSALVSDYQLAPIEVGHGSTLVFQSERNTKLPNHRFSHQLGVTTHVRRLFGKAAGMYPYVLTGHSITRTGPQTWCTVKLPNHKRKAGQAHSTYTLLIEAPRSDADLNVFSVIEHADRDFWAFFNSSTFHSTEDFTRPPSLQARFMAEIVAKKKDSQRIDRSYQLRIEELRSYAELDGLAINGASETDFWAFIMSKPTAREAELVLLDNGNLRAIWDDEDGNHFGLQFVGNRTLQYVIFRRRKWSKTISRVAGRDTFDGVQLQVQSFELGTLLHK